MRKKKLISFLIAAVMIFAFIPTSAFAGNAEEDPKVIEAEQKIAAGQAVRYDSEAEANAMKAYLESKGYTNIQVKYNNPVIQVGLPIHWKDNVYNPLESATITYAIDRDADFIVLTDYSLFSNSTVWVIPLKKGVVLTGDMIEEILRQSHLTSKDGYDFNSFGQVYGRDEVTYFTEQDRILVTDSPQTLNLKHEMTSTDKIGWVKRIELAEGPKVDFDWDCYFANENALDYWGGEAGGYHGLIMDDMCLIHSTSDSNRPYTYSTGRINWDMPEFGYFVTATAPEAPVPGGDPVDPGDEPSGGDPVDPGDEPSGGDPVDPGDEPSGGDPDEPGDEPSGGDPVEPGDEPPGGDPDEPGDDSGTDDEGDPEGEQTPVTGDIYNIGAFLVLMCVSGAGMIAVGRKKKCK